MPVVFTATHRQSKDVSIDFLVPQNSVSHRCIEQDADFSGRSLVVDDNPHDFLFGVLVVYDDAFTGFAS